MAVQVRVQNFQSIEDQTITIDGLTTITGSNNSGKTAVMRAIRGVFTNPPAGPLVRIGAAHLRVTLTFGDGSEIVWEKGWEKPGQSGKTINRYTINGKTIEGVGRGVPPEVEVFGVREIPAGSDRLWPQVADQFDGNLFLVNKPGSMIAEALSDVDRVGKLTSALKASEKDRRAVSAELKVRRADVVSHQTEVARFDGLDTVSTQIRSLSVARDALRDAESRVVEVRALRDRWVKAKAAVESLSGFDPDVIPNPAALDRLRKGVQKVQGLQSRWETAHNAVSALKGFDPDTGIPDPDEARQAKTRWERAHDYATRLTTARAKAGRYKGLDPDLLDSLSLAGGVGSAEERATKVLGAYKAISALWDQRGKLVRDVDNLVSESEAVDKSQADAEAEVVRLLGDRGVCPTCNTVHKPVGKELDL